MDMYFLSNSVFGSTVESYINEKFVDDAGIAFTRIQPSEIIGIKVVDGDTTYIIKQTGDNRQIPETILKQAFDLFIKYSEWLAKTERQYIYDPYGNEIGYTVNGHNVYYDVEYE